MANCPKCTVALQTIRQRDGVYFYCYECHGRAVTIPQIRRNSGDRFASALTRKVNTATEISSYSCPFCSGGMKRFEIANPEMTLDSCKSCVSIWFEAGKFEELPEGLIESPDAILLNALEVEAKEKMKANLALDEGFVGDSPDEDWKWIPAVFGFPVKYDSHEMSGRPWMTWSLSLLITLISFWAFSDLEYAVATFGMIPAEIWRYGGLTMITAFFIHAGLLHLFGNLYFFLLFGGSVEDTIGRWRFLGLIFLATIVGNVSHTLFDPHSTEPCIGASGGISGVLVFYALEFPGARLGFLTWRFGWVRIPAWCAFVLWLMLQLVGVGLQRAGISHVSSLAHIGGVVTGFILWLWWRKIKFKRAKTASS